jgi:hypothetical protein
MRRQACPDRHRPRDRELELLLRVGAHEPHLVRVDRSRAPERPGDRRHLGPVAVGADPDRYAPREVHARDTLEEAVDEVLARLLAVRDDVDARRLLLLERREHRVPLALLERRAGEAPRRPERVWGREPGRLREAAGDRGQQHDGSPADVPSGAPRWTPRPPHHAPEFEMCNQESLPTGLRVALSVMLNALATRGERDRSAHAPDQAALADASRACRAA